MKTVFRAALSCLFLGLGIFCFACGNPSWLVSAGFKDWTLPGIFVILGTALGAVAAIHAWPVTGPKQVSGV